MFSDPKLNCNQKILSKKENNLEKIWEVLQNLAWRVSPAGENIPFVRKLIFKIKTLNFHQKFQFL